MLYMKDGSRRPVRIRTDDSLVRGKEIYRIVSYSNGVVRHCRDFPMDMCTDVRILTLFIEED